MLPKSAKASNAVLDLVSSVISVKATSSKTTRCKKYHASNVHNRGAHTCGRRGFKLSGDLLWQITTVPHVWHNGSKLSLPKPYTKPSKMISSTTCPAPKHAPPTLCTK